MTSISHQELIQNYQVVRVLGEGSFGKVFLVRHKDTKIQYAMKKYSKYHILKNGKEKALIRSSRILQSLDHSKVIKFLYYSIGDEQDEIFLIFQACKKGNLQQIKTKIFEIKQISLIRQIMYQLAEGLQYLKNVCVAHRDIKPSNISFSSSGDLKIIDFDQAICFRQNLGLFNQDQSFAKQLSYQTSSMKTYSRRSRVNSFVGTQLYMSPQMKNMTKTDERGDIWAFGCILFQMVSGRSFLTQYQQDDSVDITLQRLSNELRQDESIDKQQISNILDLLLKILQQNPDNRISIDEIMKHSFFQQYENHEKRIQNRKKLIKFLKGNFNLFDPRNVFDALNMDLIGMKATNQKFLLLTQYPIFIRCQKQYINKKQTFTNKITKIFQKLTTLREFKISYLFGGAIYFKERSTLKQQKKSQYQNCRRLNNNIRKQLLKMEQSGKRLADKMALHHQVNFGGSNATRSLVRTASAHLERLNYPIKTTIYISCLFALFLQISSNF